MVLFVHHLWPGTARDDGELAAKEAEDQEEDCDVGEVFATRELLRR